MRMKTVLAIAFLGGAVDGALSARYPWAGDGAVINILVSLGSGLVMLLGVSPTVAIVAFLRWRGNANQDARRS
ncbi:MAG: hypothetical protein WAK03_06300 [Methylocystis sp.]|jgi:hypothetical protein